MSIKKKLIVLTVGMFILFTGAMVFLSAPLLRSGFEHVLLHEQFATAQRIASDIDHKLKERIQGLASAAANLPGDLRAQSLEAYLAGLNGVRTLFPEGVTIIGLDGRTIADLPATAGLRGGFLGDRDYFHGILAGRKHYIGKPAAGRASHRPVLTIAVPVLGQDGELRAVMTGTVDLAAPNILGVVADPMMTGQGELLVIAPDDNLILAATDGKAMTAPPARGANAFYDRVAGGFEGSITDVGPDGIEKLYSTVRVPSSGWIVLATLPADAAFAPLDAMRHYLHVAFAAVTLLAILGLWRLMQHVLAPLEEARKAMRRMTDGREALSQLPVRRNDEVGQLIGSFNLLVAERRRYKDSLLASERRESAHNRVLEMLAEGASLFNVLTAIVHEIQAENPAILGSILLLERQQRLVTVAAPGLPDIYMEAVSGAADGVAAGSFGAAVLAGKRAIATDIASSPAWEHCRDAITKAGLRTCWAEPIRDMSGEVLGAVAFYSKEANAPAEADLQLLVRTTYLARIAIERSRSGEEHRLTMLVFNNSNEAMAVTDVNGIAIKVNPAFTKITGYRADEVVGRNMSVLKSGRHSDAFYREMWHAMNVTGQWQGEIWNKRKNGDVFVEWLSINTIFGEDRFPQCRIALFSDITQKKRSDELIWKQANFDALTELPNRRMFHHRLEQEIRKANRSGRPLALLYLDLDRFKEVNDTLGHAEGDQLLVEVAQRLIACVRDCDTVARIGGDEFTVILSDLRSQDNAERVAREALRRLSEPVMLGDETIRISASIGITVYPRDAREAKDLIQNADQAMYAAKGGGRNRYCCFKPSMHEAAQLRRRLAGDLRGALAKGQLHVHYQPIVELATGCVRKAEALARWQHPQLGRIDPPDFIPIAEDIGLINDIDEWVLGVAVDRVARWRALIHPDFQISVNTSPTQYRNGDCFDVCLDLLGRRALPGNSIAMEITEKLLHDGESAGSAKLAALRSAGIEVLLDDFGSGHSSLFCLNKLDIDYIKIDRAFVGNLDRASEDIALNEAIIAMAHRLGRKVIAEGVETERQRDLLIAAGCDFAQGHLFSEAMPAELFEKFALGPVLVI